MRMKKSEAKHKQEMNNNWREIWAWVGEAVMLVFSVFTKGTIRLLAVATLVIILFIKAWLIFKGCRFRQAFKREQQLNLINKTIFDSLYKLNSLKIRSILRHTYGTVPKWNPINYKENILVYDVHEYIRSILVGITDVIIGLDPDRFNDKNVSAALIYCYPEDETGNISKRQDKEKAINTATRLPLEGKFLEEHDDFWKLISSGDTSGNANSISKYLEKTNSFYVFVDCFGTVFLNDKFQTASPNQMEKLKERIEERKTNKITTYPTAFFISDTHDLEHAHDGICAGSAIGTVINIKNDNPEDVFVKAILTINTYGDSIFAASSKQQRVFFKKSIDKHGMSLNDYEDIIRNTILPTYVRLLEAELAQMYIRHSIKHKHRCRLTGRIPECHNGSLNTSLSSCSLCTGCGNCNHICPCKKL